VVALAQAALLAVGWGQREVLTAVGLPVSYENGRRVATNDATAASNASWISTSECRSPQTEVHHGGRVGWDNRLDADW